jgi:bifunctional DNase/RNase
MMVPVRIERVTLDTASNRFVVILKDDSENRWLPIVVGPAEAQAIALQLEQVSPPRPMTHDLIRNILKALDIQIIKVVITELKDNTYFAVIEIKDRTTIHPIDARPSDAIALALRLGTSIFVNESVMKKASITEQEESAETVTEKDEIQVLNIELMNAVKEERYEDAAKIRDRIKLLGQKMPKEKGSDQ